MRRIALFSDVHGNLPALDAVLADIAASHAVDEVYCLGDLVGYGPDPAGVIARIRSAGIPTIAGNYDEGIGHRRGECGCYYATEQARIDGAASYEFTDASLGDVDREWLVGLLDEIKLEEGGARVLLAHGSPRKINEYLLPDRTDEQLARLAAAAEADVVCVGHIHIPYHRVLDGASGPVHYVSSGSAGKPKDGDPRACWVELLLGEADEVRMTAPVDGSIASAGSSEVWVGAVVHRVAYDAESVAVAMLAAGLPSTLARRSGEGEPRGGATLTGMNTLFIDADACPVTREAITVAREHGMAVILVANSTQNLEKHTRRNGVDSVQVSGGADAADFAIVERIAPDDVVVTQDIGVAAMVLGRGAGAISPRGRIFYLATIDIEMEVRHAEAKHRRAGGRTGGPRAFTDEDREHFIDQLERLIRDRRREAATEADQQHRRDHT